MGQPTRLAAYLRKTKIGQAEFAEKIGATVPMVWRYAHGDRVPTVQYAVAIERATAGAVPVTYWAGIERSRKQRRRRDPPSSE